MYLNKGTFITKHIYKPLYTTDNRYIIILQNCFIFLKSFYDDSDVVWIREKNHTRSDKPMIKSKVNGQDVVILSMEEYSQLQSFIRSVESKLHEMEMEQWVVNLH